MFPLWQSVGSLLIPEFRNPPSLLGRNPLSLPFPVPESGVTLPERGWQESKKSAKMPPCCLETYMQLLSWQVEGRGCF